jgi:hypothetical protein
MKKVAILQSNYIPWKGYFDLIRSVDEFILYDEMQYTRRDWRNRNKIKTPQGAQWLTIAVENKGKYLQKISETLVSDESWQKRHWDSIYYNYAKAKHFKEYADVFNDLYKSTTTRYLSEINFQFIQVVCKVLGITTKISWSKDYELKDGKTERLVDLCKQSGATEYISGPAAKDYIKPEFFSEAGIKLSYVDYSNYLEYPQLFPPFDHYVSVLDLLFNAGPDSLKYMAVK